MGHVSFSIPRDIVVEFQQKGAIENFIETGTYKGGTCFWAARHFKNVYTIEIDPEISKETASRKDCPTNIQFYVGNSKDVMPELVRELEGRSFFWLDGHWCGVTEIGKDMECPLMDEIDSLSALKDSVILIDDARAFLGPLPPPHDSKQWPRVDEVIVSLKKSFPDSFVTIIDDVIYSIPPDLIAVFDRFWINSFPKRFTKKNNLIKRFLG